MQPFQASSRAVGGPFFTIYRRSVPVIGFTWHFHADFEINFVQRGRGRRFVGDSIQPFGDGDLALLGPHLPHSWEAPAAPDARSMEFVVGVEWRSPPRRRVPRVNCCCASRP
jgi:hypothetical protein